MGKRLLFGQVILIAAVICSLSVPLCPAAGTEQLPHPSQQQGRVTATSPASASASSNQATIQFGQAKIFLPETSFDFGVLSQGTETSHTFQVKNKGDAPLKLIKAKGS